MSIWGDGENTKDYLFLTDFLDAVQIVVTCGLTGTFNVASEQSLSVNNIVSLVESLAGKKLRLAHCPAFSWDVRKATFPLESSAQRRDGARDMISWKPSGSVRYAG